MTSTAVLKVENQEACRHHFKRVQWRASSLHQFGFGGYYEVGTFDTTITCRDCGAELYVVPQGPPLCQGCLAPMALVEDNQGIASCGDTLTDTFLAGVDLATAKGQYQARLRRFWQWHCQRAEADEQKILDQKVSAGAVVSLGERMAGSMHRIFRRSAMLQVWPYVCTSSNCQRQGKLKWLETPGD